MEKTLSAYRELGPKRYRETSGLYYEDFEAGDVFEHRPGRTITDSICARALRTCRSTFLSKIQL